MHFICRLVHLTKWFSSVIFFSSRDEGKITNKNVYRIEQVFILIQLFALQLYMIAVIRAYVIHATCNLKGCFYIIEFVMHFNFNARLFWYKKSCNRHVLFPNTIWKLLYISQHIFQLPMSGHNLWFPAVFFKILFMSILICSLSPMGRFAAYLLRRVIINFIYNSSAHAMLITTLYDSLGISVNWIWEVANRRRSFLSQDLA